MMKAAKMIVPKRMPNTLSIIYPPTSGRMTFGQEYQAYNRLNWYVLMPIASLVSCCKAKNKSN